MTESVQTTGPAMPTPAALRPPPADPSSFGRVDPDGTVYLLAPEGEIRVGQWAAGPAAEGLAFFARKYDDLVVELDLAARRLGDRHATPAQAQQVLKRVQEALAARSFVGDVRALEARCTLVGDAIERARAVAKERKAEVQAQAAALREALAAEAERLADSTAWKPTGDRFAAIVEEWKGIPRGDRTLEQELWKRISTARAAFDKRRRAHFADLEIKRKAATAAKRELIAKAEAIAASTDWQAGVRALRDLMARWKEAPRGPKSEEDKLWRRFKAAMDAFYSARTAAEAEAEEKLKGNVEPKELLVREAEALLPIRDLKAAKRSLREIQARWDKLGDLPKGDRDRLEKRLRRVEDEVRKVEADSWRRSNPEVRARAESTANAFSESLAKLHDRLAKAEAAGDEGAAAKLRTSIEQTEALLGAARSAASEYAS